MMQGRVGPDETGPGYGDLQAKLQRELAPKGELSAAHPEQKTASRL